MSLPPLPLPPRAHLMAGCRRWVLRAWTRTSGEKAGWPGPRSRSTCAVLLRAWTPASVRLEMVNLTGARHFSRPAASCRETARTGWWSLGLGAP